MQYEKTDYSFPCTNRESGDKKQGTKTNKTLSNRPKICKFALNSALTVLFFLFYFPLYRHLAPSLQP